MGSGHTAEYSSILARRSPRRDHRCGNQRKRPSPTIAPTHTDNIPTVGQSIVPRRAKKAMCPDRNKDPILLVPVIT